MCKKYLCWKKRIVNVLGKQIKSLHSHSACKVLPQVYYKRTILNYVYFLLLDWSLKKNTATVDYWFSDNNGNVLASM